MNQKYDVAIIGAGPGGYVSAIRSSQLGLKTVIIEKQHLGGICLNWGCIPTKALLKCSEINHLLQNLDKFGFKAENISFDFNKIISRSRQVAEKLSSGIAHLLKKNKIDVIMGHASFLNGHQLSIQNNNDPAKLIEAKNFVIATGARARILKDFEPDQNLIWTYKEAMLPKRLPKSLVIVGAGAIGVEFASFYQNMGSQVTLVEMQERILTTEDSEIAAIAHKSFTKQGIKILTSSKLAKITKFKDHIDVFINDKNGEHKISAEALLIAAGVTPNIENLGLEKANIKLENNQIKVNQFCQTNQNHIYAIGDVIDGPWLAHKASHEGVLVAEKISGKTNLHPVTKENIPGCVYSMPQIASIGLTEEQAKLKNLAIKVGKFPFLGNGKALASGEEEGLIKTIFDSKTGELLGAHMIGAEVTELVQSFSLLKTLEGTEEDIFNTIFPHPTLSEMIQESSFQAFNRAIHI